MPRAPRLECGVMRAILLPVPSLEVGRVDRAEKVRKRRHFYSVGCFYRVKKAAHLLLYLTANEKTMKLYQKERFFHFITDPLKAFVYLGVRVSYSLHELHKMK